MRDRELDQEKTIRNVRRACLWAEEKRAGIARKIENRQERRDCCQSQA